MPGPQADNCTFLARRSFTLEQLPDRATLLIAAEARYAVYVNGHYVGTGPARGTHYRYFYDSYEVGSLLVAGQATPLRPASTAPLSGTTGTVPPVLPALIALIEPLVGTDASWEVCVDPAHRADALFYTHHIGYSEYRDLRRDPVGWELGADRSGGWQGARELCAGGARLGGRELTARDIPPLTERHYRPARIVATGAVPLHRAGIEEDVDYAGLMQVEMHLGLSHSLFREVDALTRGGTATIRPSPRLTTLAAAEGAYLIADFERAICGHLTPAACSGPQSRCGPLPELDFEAGDAGELVPVAGSQPDRTGEGDGRDHQVVCADRTALAAQQRSDHPVVRRRFIIKREGREGAAEPLHPLQVLCHPRRVVRAEGEFGFDDTAQTNRSVRVGEQAVRQTFIRPVDEGHTDAGVEHPHYRRTSTSSGGGSSGSIRSALPWRSRSLRVSGHSVTLSRRINSLTQADRLRCCSRARLRATSRTSAGR